MKIYKYMKKEHYRDFKENGKLYINTLYNLRTCPHEPIRDKLEGIYNLRIEPKDNALNLSTKEFKKLYSKVTIAEEIPNALTVEPEGIAVSTFITTNAFVFCTSLVSDRRLNKKWQYDCYFEIRDSDAFAFELYKKIGENTTILYYKYDKVRYRQKDIKISQENKQRALNNAPKTLTDYVFSKPLEFKDEKEYRLIFIPEYKMEINPLIITCPELLRYCKFSNS